MSLGQALSKISAMSPEAWGYLYTHVDCVIKSDKDNVQFKEYSKRGDLNGSGCIKHQDQGGAEGERRRSVWIPAQTENLKDLGCLWMYQDTDCKDADTVQTMQYYLKDSTATCWNFDPSMAGNNMGFHSY